MLAVVAGVTAVLNARAKDSAPAVVDARVGTIAPAFDLEALNDDSRTALSDLSGSVVVLDFWATHCAPCRRSMPHVDRLAERYAEDGVRVLSVNVDFPDEDRISKVEAFIRSAGVDADVFLDNGNTAYLYGARRIPLIVMIDGDGMIQRVFQGYTGYNLLADAVESLL